ERAKGAQAAHQTVTGAAGRPPWRRRSAATSANEIATVNPTSATIAASPPGQSAPAPSAPQKMPNEVSITPTAYLSAFSGTGRTVSAGPSTATITASSSRAAPAPASAERQPRVNPIASTIVTASTPSTVQATKTVKNSSRSRLMALDDGRPAPRPPPTLGRPQTRIAADCGFEGASAPRHW